MNFSNYNEFDDEENFEDLLSTEVIVNHDEEAEEIVKKLDVVKVEESLTQHKEKAKVHDEKNIDGPSFKEKEDDSLTVVDSLVLQKEKTSSTNAPTISIESKDGVNHDTNSPVPEKSDVVFVGWKNENTSTIVSSIPSIEGDSESVSQIEQQQKEHNMQQQPKPINRFVMKKGLSSISSPSSDKQKKNLWKGVLGLTQRSSPQKKTPTRAVQLVQKGFNPIDVSKFDSNSSSSVISYQSDISISGSEINVVGTGEESERNLATSKQFGENTAIKDDIAQSGIVDDRSEDSHKSVDDMSNASIDVSDLGDSKHRPDSPPSLNFTNKMNDSLDLSVASSTNTPVGQRRKQFGRKMKIQPTGINVAMKKRLQSSIMKDDAKSTKNFVQIQPYYAYREGFQMSNSELYQEMMKKSSNVETLISTMLGNGAQEGGEKQIGSLKVEVLSCMGLPHFRRSKPNSIAYLVCGDVAFATDVIHSSLNPIYPSRSKRAGEFPLFHGYARLYCGIFNVTDKDNDDFIGRSMVDLSTLCPNRDYDVSLPLKTSGLVYDRQPRGVVRLRFRLTWTRQRDAIISYLPSKLSELCANIDEPSDLVTIPCADTKSIRNVAFTVHGEDLPGKYSKSAFRAITRELNLYKFQIPIVCSRTFLKLTHYEKPYISSYIFLGWMMLLHFRLYCFFPSFLVSIVLVVHVNNYHDLSSKIKLYRGYEPLSVVEIMNHLVALQNSTSSIDDRTCSAADTPFSKCYDMENYKNVIGELKFPIATNMEFPFSESKYNRLPLKSKFCPKVLNKKRPGVDTRDDNEFLVDSQELGDRYRIDSEDNQLYEDMKENMDGQPTSSKCLPSGPEQDDHIETREANFQESVNNIEDTFHSLTGDLFREQISRSISNSNENVDNSDQGIPGVQVNKFINPLAVLSDAFFEPVMGAISVYILAVRSIFNIASWKDPFISFWFLVLLAFIMIGLAIFPWRSFFIWSGLIFFGPQNYFIQNPIVNYIIGDVLEKNYEGDEVDFKKNGKPSRRKQKTQAPLKYSFDRPLFTTRHSAKQSKKKNSTPLEVVVPYSRTRRERFYFWPPYSIIPPDESKLNINHEMELNNKKEF